MIEQAQDLYERGDVAAAYTLYEKMLAEEPENHEVLFMMSMCRQRQENIPAASELLERALLLNPTQAMYHYAMGGLYLRQQAVAQAEGAYVRAAQLNPNYAEAHVGAGYVQLIQQKFSAAEAAFRAALRANPRVPGAHGHLGVTLLALDRVEDALGVLREGAELYPNDAYTQTHLGRAFQRAQLPAFAAQCFRNALKSNGKEPALWLWLGQSLVAAGQDEEAVEALRQCLEHGGESAEALFQLGQLYLRHGQAQGALNLLLRVVRLQPQALAPRLAVARACRALGRYEEAQDILQVVSEDNQARKLLTRLALDQDQVAEARGHLAALSLAGVDDSDTQLLRAESAIQQEDWQQAEQQLAPLLAAQPAPPSAHLLAAQAAYFQQQPDVARAQLDAVPAELQARLGADYQDWRVRVLHQQGQVGEAWALARSQPTAQSSMLSALQAAPPSDQSAPSAGEIAASFNRDTIWSWPVRGPEDDQADPILVYGWPGSGREALLAALSTFTSVSVLRDRLDGQSERGEAIGWPRGGAALSQLSDAEIRLRRKRYWRELRRLLPHWQQQPVVDSLYFSAAALPTLYRLFPTARVVVIQREETALQMDWALSAYTALPEMAAAYRQEQALLQQALEQLPLQWITLDYAALHDYGADTLQALTQHLAGVDAYQLAERFARIQRRLAMPAQMTDEDRAQLAQHYQS